MKKLLVIVWALMSVMALHAQSKVYMTKEISPEALDQACLDLVFNHKAQPGADEKPLIERINCQHGTYITDYV